MSPNFKSETREKFNFESDSESETGLPLNIETESESETSLKTRDSVFRVRVEGLGKFWFRYCVVFRNLPRPSIPSSNW